MVLVTARGKQSGVERIRSCRLIDFDDRKNFMTAMMRTTAYPTSIIVHSLYDVGMLKRGAFTAEEVVPYSYLDARLKQRFIAVETIEER